MIPLFKDSWDNTRVHRLLITGMLSHDPKVRPKDLYTTGDTEVCLFPIIGLYDSSEWDIL